MIPATERALDKVHVAARASARTVKKAHVLWENQTVSDSRRTLLSVLSKNVRQAHDRMLKAVDTACRMTKHRSFLREIAELVRHEEQELREVVRMLGRTV
jgi:hypothetical protein